MMVDYRPTACEKCGSLHIVAKGQVQRLGACHHRWKCKGCGTNMYVNVSAMKKGVKPPPEKFVLTDDELNGIRDDHVRFVITSAQNDTPINEDFFSTLKAYCQHHDARLLIIPIRYKNPDSFHTAIQDSYTWDDRVRPYFIENKFEITPDVCVFADLFIGATNQNPIAGLESLTKGRTIIVGHNQLQMKTCARLPNENPVIVTTTGSVCVENYSQSRAGYFADSNHTNSAVLVEIDVINRIFHLRHLIADESGGFHDCEYQYTPDGQMITSNIGALVTGDEHAVVADAEVLDATYFNDDSMTASMLPEYVVRHDLFDCYAVSSHHNNNFFLRAQKEKKGTSNLRDELELTLNHLVDTTGKSEFTNIVVASNHNSHLRRWMNDPKSALDVENADIYTRLRSLMLVNNGEPFDLWLRSRLDEIVAEFPLNVLFTDRFESFDLFGVEISLHGDIGPNGSRGSITSFAKMGKPMVIGHSHSPSIKNSTFQVGTSTTLLLEYNAGPSSWMHTHCVIHKNGKMQLINIIEGRWRLNT